MTVINNQGLQSNLPEFRNARFLRVVEQVCLGNPPTVGYEDRDKFWRSVCFMNLAQRLLPSRSERPNDADFDLAWGVALEVCKALNVKFVLKLAKDGFGRLGYYLNNSKTDWKISAWQTNSSAILKNGSHELKIICINHPTGSRGFQRQKWSSVFKEHFPDF